MSTKATQAQATSEDLGHKQAESFIKFVEFFGKVFSIPGRIPPPNKNSTDLTIPFMAAFIVTTLFLLLYNFLPLFDAPTRAQSIHQVMAGTSEWIQSKPLKSLFAQYWVILTIFMAFWVFIVFVVHQQDKDVQTYMMGITLTVITILITFVTARYLIGLFFIKAMQVWNWPAHIVDFKIGRLLIRDAITWLTLTPLLSVVTTVKREIGTKGIVTLVLFFFLLIATYIAFDYYSPIPKPKPGNGQTIPGVTKDSVVRVKIADTVKAQPIKNVLAAQIKLTPVGEADAFIIGMRYRKRAYLLWTKVVIENNTDKTISLPYYKSLRLNLITDDVQLKKQDKGRSGDFVFDMIGNKAKKITSLSIKPNSKRIIRLRGYISHMTYDYLLRHMRNNNIDEYAINFILALEDQHQSIDVEQKHNVVFRFVNGETYGN